MQPGNLSDGAFPVNQESIRTGNLQISSHFVCSSDGDIAVCRHQILLISPELILAVVPCLAGGQFIGSGYRPINVAAGGISSNDDIADFVDRKIPFANANLSQPDLFIDRGRIFCRYTVRI